MSRIAPERTRRALPRAADSDSPEVARGPGRPKGQTADATKERILDAGESLFAEGGYEGTSIRDIADVAGLQLAAIGYHFGPKEALFDAVVKRRAAIMNARRITSLAAARASKARGKSLLVALIRGYVAPFFEMASGGDQGWRNYATLMGRLANSQRGTDVISRHYDTTARAYIDAFLDAVPGASEQAVVDGFMVMVSAMLAVCAGTGRAERLMDTTQHPTPADATFNDLVNFIEAGFSAMARQSQTAPLRKTKP
jgi:AcrR family transcriptional regulator